MKIVANCPDQLGEGPAYDAAEGRLLWVDLLGEQIREARIGTGGQWEMVQTLRVDGRVSAVVPRRSGGLLAIVEKEVLALSESGETTPVARLDEPGAVRLNDAKCDPQGRLVAGWVDQEGVRGGVIRVDREGAIETIVAATEFANGLDWSPDGTIFYLVDTNRLSVYAFDYDGDGALGGRRDLFAIERGVGAPDGIAVDDEGCVWVALPYAGEVRRYSPDGEQVDCVKPPTLLPTSCAFGGEDGGDLFITSQAGGLVARGGENLYGISVERVDAAHGDPLAGALFVCRPGVTGPAAIPFAD